MSSPLDDVFITDEITDDERVEDVKGEDSSSSDSPGEGSDSESEGSAEKPTPVEGNRVAELERKSREMESRLAELVYENAGLKTAAKASSAKEDDPFSLDQLKEFAAKDEGKYAFDAGAHYTNQEVSRLENQIKELRDAQSVSEEQALTAVVSEILPGLDDKFSENYRKVQNEALSMQKRGIRDPGKAWEAAMFKVASGSQAPAKKAADPEYSARRAREEAGGVGAPNGGGGSKGAGGSMTNDQLVVAKSMGLKNVFSKDPKVRSKARKMFIHRSKDYEDRRIS